MMTVDRRTFLGLTGLGGLAALIGTTGILPGQDHDMSTMQHAMHTPMPDETKMSSHGMDMPGMVGEVDHQSNGFNPSEILTDFDEGRVSLLPNGQTLHEYDFIALNKEIELASGLVFPAWTYNGRIPGPTIRVREGDRVRVNFSNATEHPHTVHFHGIHPGESDGVFEPVPPDGTFVYEFDAEPFGVHLYHCHVMPLAKHIAKGMYGAFIIDPRDGWKRADHEFVMVMNGFDVDYDNANEIYAVNTIPFHFDKHPIRIKVGELVRIFLINILEYDPINSFHLHANFFNYYPTGTSLIPSEYADTISQMQAQRGMLEFTYSHPGRYMFHAHKTEFAELGWTGIIEVEG
ncbi:MAG: multicopper oxidase domain-containing protein [Anaerolineaceae bacterium]